MINVIIGGTKGLGIHLANEFYKRGDSVIIIGRTKPLFLNKSIQFFKCDLIDNTDIDKTLNKITEKYGKINNLIFSQRNRSLKSNLNNDFIINIQSTSIIIDFFLNNKFDHDSSCSVIFISSILNKFISDNQDLSYHIIKASLIQLMKFHAVRNSELGIRFNAISPASFIKDENREYYENISELTNFYKKLSPLRRMGNTTDICNLILFLCSHNSSYINGQDIKIDGGTTLLNPETLYLRTILK